MSLANPGTSQPQNRVGAKPWPVSTPFGASSTENVARDVLRGQNGIQPLLSEIVSEQNRLDGAGPGQIREGAGGGRSRCDAWRRELFFFLEVKQ